MLKSALTSREEVGWSFRRSNVLSGARNFATMPTSRSVAEVRAHACRMPDVLPSVASIVLDASLNADCCGRTYAESGGKSSVAGTELDEYAADASKYGRGMSRLVSVSGNENHDFEAAGMLSSVGLYAELLGSAGLPRSDSPLSLLFIGDLE